MGDWLDGYQRVAPSRTPTGPRTAAPPCIVLHTVEGDPAPANSPGIFAGHPYPPQLWVDLDDGPLMQAIPLTLSGLALEHPRGTPETNHMGIVVQVEIEGRAAETHLWPGEKLRRLGENVLAPVAQALGIRELVPYRPVGEPSATGYGKAAPSRMTPAEWSTRIRNDGTPWNVCGHQNVPDNQHWDPGKLDFATACAFGNRMLKSTGAAAVERLEKVTGFPGQIKIEGASAQQRLYAYFTPEGADRYEAKVVVYPKDGRFVRYVDVTGGATYRVDLDDGANGVPGAPMTVEVDAAATVPAVPVGNPHPVKPATDLAGIRRQALLVKAALAETNKLVDDLVARIDS